MGTLSPKLPIKINLLEGIIISYPTTGIEANSYDIF